MKKSQQVKRSFSTLVRRPYQDAIAVVLKCYDHHIEMAAKGIDSDFHKKQAARLKAWTIDQKDYIVEIEKEDVPDGRWNWYGLGEEDG